MIIVRRFFAVLLVPVFLVTLLMMRVNDTFFETGFYANTLTELDVFNFIYDEAIPYVIDKSQREGTFPLVYIPTGIDATPEGISSTIKRVFPPEWLEENAHAIINAAVPYIRGDEQNFGVTVTLDDRLEVGAEVFEELLIGADIHEFLIDERIQGAIDESNILGELPLGISLTSKQLMEGVIEIIPELWFDDQVAGAIEEMLPYMLGRMDSFSITIPLQERAEMGINVLEDWVLTGLEDDSTYQFLLQEQIAPAVQSALGSVVQLPYGVTFTNAEVVAAISAVLPREWVAERMREMIPVIGPYMVGRTESFVFLLPLADRTTLAASVLVVIADAKFSEAYMSIRTCSLQDLFDLTLSLDSLPACRPPFVSYEQLKGVIGLDVLEELVAAIVKPLPETLALTDELLFAQFEANGPFDLDDLRKTLRGGYVFTEQELESLIRSQSAGPAEGERNVALLGDIRKMFRDGFAFDDTHLRNQIGSDFELEMLDRARWLLSSSRSSTTYGLLILGLVALAAGFLGGRRWGSRLAWAGLPVLLSGCVSAIMLGPVAAYAFEVIDGSIRGLEANSIVISKILDARIFMEASFVTPMVSQSLGTTLFGAGLLIFGAILVKRGNHKARWE